MNVCVVVRGGRGEVVYMLSRVLLVAFFAYIAKFSGEGGRKGRWGEIAREG